MSLCLPDNEIRTDDCSTFVRRVAGPESDELFFLCRPTCGTSDVVEQAEAVYTAMLELLEAEDASFATVASETLFLSNTRRDLELILDTRRRLLEAAGGGPARPARPAACRRAWPSPGCWRRRWPGD